MGGEERVDRNLFDRDVNVERMRFPLRLVLVLFGVVATVLLSFKAAEQAVGKELGDVRTRISIVETKQQTDDQRFQRLEQTLDRFEVKLDRLLERAR